MYFSNNNFSFLNPNFLIQLLAGNSKYFDNLFFGDWSDKKKAENYFEIVEANDFDVQAFGFMIYAIMTMGGMVNRSNFLLNDENDG